MALDIITVCLGLAVGVSQGFFVTTKQMSPRVRLVGALLAASALSLAIGGVADGFFHSQSVRAIAFLAALMFFIIWLLMIGALARHNTSM